MRRAAPISMVMRPGPAGTGRHVAMLACLLAAGCVSTAAPERTAVMEDLGLEMTARRARVATQNAASWYMSTIEITADEIAEVTDDPQVRVNSISWKANAIPAFQLAMFQSDPLVSYVDGWTLLVQMRQYLETGIGKNLFAEQQHLAVEAMRDLEEGIDLRVHEHIEPEIAERLNSFVYRWAEEHPLDNELFQRRSVSEQVVDLLSEQQGGGLSQLGSMAQMAEDAQQMALVLASYTPKEIRWQSELMVASLTDTAKVASLVGAVENLSLVEATTDLIENTPELIAEERLAVLNDVERQRLATLAESFELVEKEREILLREVGQMIAAERQAIMVSVEELTTQSFEETRGVIDHLMRWVVLLGVGGVVVVAVGFAIVMRYLYTRRP